MDIPEATTSSLDNFDPEIWQFLPQELQKPVLLLLPLSDRRHTFKVSKKYHKWSHPNREYPTEDCVQDQFLLSKFRADNTPFETIIGGAYSPDYAPSPLRDDCSDS